MKKFPHGCAKILRLMNNGHRLFWGPNGPWMMRPGASTYSIHFATARALARRKLIMRGDGFEMVINRQNYN